MHTRSIMMPCGRAEPLEMPSVSKARKRGRASRSVKLVAQRLEVAEAQAQRMADQTE